MKEPGILFVSSYVLMRSESRRRIVGPLLRVNRLFAVLGTPSKSWIEPNEKKPSATPPPTANLALATTEGPTAVHPYRCIQTVHVRSSPSLNSYERKIRALVKSGRNLVECSSMLLQRP